VILISAGPYAGHDIVERPRIGGRSEFVRTGVRLPGGRRRGIDQIPGLGGDDRIVPELKVTRWFTFQPVFQYYFDTGANPLMRNLTVAGFRTTFSL